MKALSDAAKFHGHVCPGLAIGYRVAKLALKELGKPSKDEELVAIVENDSCAVDAVQLMTGCTFGKGNLIFKDYGKQAYTFFRRGPGRKGLRISVDWTPPEETPLEGRMWQLYMKGDRSARVLKAVHERKSRKIQSIMLAKDSELFKVEWVKIAPPAEARIYPGVRCSICGEKVMEPRARVKGGRPVCIPCFEGGE